MQHAGLQLLHQALQQLLRARQPAFGAHIQDERGLVGLKLWCQLVSVLQQLAGMVQLVHGGGAAGCSPDWCCMA